MKDYSAISQFPRVGTYSLLTKWNRLCTFSPKPIASTQTRLSFFHSLRKENVLEGFSVFCFSRKTLFIQKAELQKEGKRRRKKDLLFANSLTKFWGANSVGNHKPGTPCRSPGGVTEAQVLRPSAAAFPDAIAGSSQDGNPCSCGMRALQAAA